MTLVRMLDKQECEPLVADILDVMAAHMVAALPDANEAELVHNLHMLAARLLMACKAALP